MKMDDLTAGMIIGALACIGGMFLAMAIRYLF